LNPVRAGLVKTIEGLDKYPWSGHSVIIGYNNEPWMDIDGVLLHFGENRRIACKRYREFVAEGMDLGRIPELTGGGLIRSSGGWSQVLALRRKGAVEESDERILGDGEFVEAVLREVDERQRRQLRIRRTGQVIGDIIDEECGRASISREEVETGGRRGPVSRVRAMIAYRSREELGLNAAEIARHLGVSTSSITRALERLERERGTVNKASSVTTSPKL